MRSQGIQDKLQVNYLTANWNFGDTFGIQGRVSRNVALELQSYGKVMKKANGISIVTTFSSS